MAKQDVRWQQRLQNYQLALKQLEEAAALRQKRALTNLELQGFIKAFEFTHELAWNVIKDFFTDQGTTNIMGSKDAVREAFHKGLIENGTVWMEMIKSRNQSSHTYNAPLAKDLAERIAAFYLPLFTEFSQTMSKRKDGQ